MIILCASHINCVQRLIYLNSMIISWYNQTIQKPLYISISYDIHMKREIIKLMELYKTKTNLFNFTIRHEKCSQFEHYNLLLNENKSFCDGDEWILFTDDDDLWNINRVEKYLDYIKENQNLDCFCIPNTISCDALYVSCVNEIDLDKCYKKLGTCEYINYAIRYTKLIETINNLKYDLSNPIFDVFFAVAMEMLISKGMEHRNDCPKNEWLYFYRQYFVCDNDKWHSKIFNDT